MEARAADNVAEARFRADPYEYAEVRELIEALDLAEPVAITLARRGCRSVEQARAFIEAGERHHFSAFEGIDRAAGSIGAAIEAGARITVHGDYDVDGISATAILVRALRGRGADCDWLIPDRAADGYGLSPATVGSLAERGTRLLVTADCGITSAAEVAAASEQGIETIVTDHHEPGPELPDCAIVHPKVSGYPFPGLCGAAVALKLVEALGASGGGPGAGDADLDLVALATIADMVPLTGENRTLARLGLAELRRARRPGVRALLEIARVEPEHLDEGDVAFRLAPRINAAGRLYRADAAVELMITEDPERAAAIAAELDAANRERREVEREVAAAAEAARRALPEAHRDAAGLVLAGEGWHRGVVGIAASRIVERHGSPAVLLSIESDGLARGSGRGVPGFDLLRALEACSHHLERFGGHRAAAGVELEANRIGEFREAFAAAAAAQLPPGSATAAERIDAVVGAEALDLRVAEQLAALGPFGQGNPEVRLLVPWARVGDVRPMGEEGRHARFQLQSGAGRASGVAFNAAARLRAAERGPSDLTVRLELNHWNGATEPRAVLSSADDAAVGEDREGGSCACGDGADAEWWERFEAEIEREPGSEQASPGVPDGTRRGRALTHEPGSVVALIAELLSSGSRVLAVAADARRRAELASPAASPARFGRTHAVRCGECPEQAFTTLGVERGGPALLLADWRSLARIGAVASKFEHLVIVDPPPTAADLELARAHGPGFLHEASADAEQLAAHCLAEEWQPRPALAEIYRGLVGGALDGEQLGSVLARHGRLRRPAAVAARCVRVLGELGLAELEGTPGARRLSVVSSERTELERSAAWRAYTARYEEGFRFLESNPRAS